MQAVLVLKGLGTWPNLGAAVLIGCARQAVLPLIGLDTWPNTWARVN